MSYKQDCTSRTQELNEDNFNVSKHNSRVAIAPPCFQSRPRSSASRQRASATDRVRITPSLNTGSANSISANLN